MTNFGKLGLKPPSPPGSAIHVVDLQKQDYLVFGRRVANLLAFKPYVHHHNHYTP